MQFSIGFDKRDTKTLHEYWDKIIDTNQWSEGYFTKTFEEKWSAYNQLPSLAFSSWAGAAYTTLNYFNVKGKTVLCPSNTFMATVFATQQAGAHVEFVDCNKEDLCVSYDDLVKKVGEHQPAAIWVVHIGGHIAFDIEKIQQLCQEKNIILLEDCAHAHGAQWNGKHPGMWGDAGIYSFYATKTVSTGEGGMLVTKHNDLIEYGKQFRNYGKFDYQVPGLNFRINEFGAAIGVVQTERLPEIVAYKNEVAQKLDEQYENRVLFPDGMISGYYKYIVFEEIEKSTGKVYDQPCHKLLKKECHLPNTDWIEKNHWCVPIYYTKDVVD